MPAPPALKTAIQEKRKGDIEARLRRLSSHLYILYPLGFMPIGHLDWQSKIVRK